MTAGDSSQRPDVRELTIDGVQWRVRLVERGSHTEAGLQYVAEFGYGCLISLGKTTLDGTEASFAAVPDDALALWARHTLQPRARRRF